MGKNKKLQQEICKWKIILSELEIKFTEVCEKGIDNKYHILYYTYQTSTGKFYVGIHSSIKEKDNYLGCGITSNIRTISVHTQRILQRSHLWKAVLKYGAKDFKRVNLFYFNDRASLIKAEKLIVNKEFVNCSWNFNCTIGGGSPPVNVGKENGNYGHKWSKQKRKEMSEYFSLTRNTKRGNNSKALKCITVDVFTREIKEYACGRDLADAIGLTHLTINTWLRKAELLNSQIRKKRFICFLKSDYQEKVQNGTLVKHIQKIIQQSKLITKPNYANN